MLITNYVDDPDDRLVSFIIGGLGWSLTAMILVIPYWWLVGDYNLSSLAETYSSNGKDRKAISFIIVLFGALVSEPIRYKTFQYNDIVDKTYSGTFYMGLGWAVSDFITRYMFFFDIELADKFLVQTFVLVSVVAYNVSLTFVLLRTDENTKFVMFAAFLKFFIDLSFFGAFANYTTNRDLYEGLGWVILLNTLMIGLAMITRKSPQSSSVVEN